MERSRGYVVKQEGLTGPATVVNIGQLVIQAAPGSSLPNREPVIEAEAISESEADPTQANLVRIPNET
jgi:hypothetical protein